MRVPRDWPREDESRGPAASRVWGAGSGAGPGPRGQRRPEGPRATPHHTLHRVPSPAPDSGPHAHARGQPAALCGGPNAPRWVLSPPSVLLARSRLNVRFAASS